MCRGRLVAAKTISHGASPFSLGSALFALPFVSASTRRFHCRLIVEEQLPPLDSPGEESDFHERAAACALQISLPSVRVPRAD